jgi:two-component system NtrC family sensor kinase
MDLPADAPVADPGSQAEGCGRFAAPPDPVRSRARGLHALVFALPLLGLIAAGYWSLRGTTTLFAGDMTRTVRLLGAETQHTLEAQQVMLIALDARVRGLDWDQIRGNPDVLAFARGLVAASATVDTLGLTSPDGHIALATETDRQPVWVDLSDRDFVAAFRPGTTRRNSFISVPVVSRVTGHPEVHLSRPRIAANGQADGGAVVAGFAPAVFEQLFAAVAASQNTGFTLLRSDGAVLARYPMPVTGAGQTAPARSDPALVPLDEAVADVPRFIESGSLLSGLHLIAIERLGAWPLVLVEEGDPHLFRARWLSMMAFPALGAVAAMLLLAVLIVRIRRSALVEAAQLREMAAAAEVAQTALVERSALEGRLRQVEKTAALGQLAAGVAHDFNNLLQTMLMGAETLQRHADNAAEVRNTAATQLKAAERGAALTRRMLQFARRDDAAAPFLVADALQEVADLLNRSFAGIHMVRLAVPEAMRTTLRGSKAEFETVVINLAVNARDAMPDGGEIVVSAALLAAAPSAVVASGEAPSAGPWLRLQVADSGLGMNAETLARAGEAFFTTKPPGRGTGLGLSMARGYVQRMGGTLEIASAPDRGTIVTLWLPAR